MPERSAKRSKTDVTKKKKRKESPKLPECSLQYRERATYVNRKKSRHNAITTKKRRAGSKYPPAKRSAVK